MKRICWTVGLTLLLGSFAGNAAAQVGSVTGKVVDQNDQPVIDAVVMLVSPTSEVQPFKGKTNKHGEFRVMTLLRKGPWILTVTKPGLMEYKSPEPINVPLGGPAVELPVIKLFPEGTKGTQYVSAEEAAKIKAEIAALQAQFSQAVALAAEAQPLLDAGDKAGAMAKLDQALAIYTAMAVQAPDVAEIYHNMAYIYSVKKAWAESADAYTKAAQLRPEMADDLGAAAAGYQNAGQRAKAIEVLVAGATKYPTNARIQVALGEVNYNSAQYEPAIAAFKKAQELDPANPEPLYFLAMIAVSQNRTQECVALLEKYVAMNPTNAQNLESAKAVLGALKPAKK